VSLTEFSHPVLDMTIRFVRDDAGDTESFVFIQGDREVTATRR
jgi:hypothetical protein